MKDRRTENGRMDFAPRPETGMAMAENKSAEFTARAQPAKSSGGSKRVEFKFRTEPGKEVFVAGTFNDWNPKKQQLKDASGTGAYSAALWLTPGKVEYKLVVDGVWCVDPDCPEWVRNQYGSLNSVLTVT